MHREASCATAEDDRDHTCSPWTPSGSLPPSSSSELVVTGYHGGNPHSEDAFHGRHHGPFLGKKAKLARRIKPRKGTAAPTSGRQ
jgi:hypothetical protein